jgi:pimeloyl-ACP methyl ester carboxylesterase
VLRRLALSLVVVALLAAGGVVWWPRPAPQTGAWMTAAGVEPLFASVAGLRLRYVRSGRGPSVVLLHGIASSIYTWKDVLPGLAADHDVIAVDLPGFGGSEIPPALSAERLRGAIVGLMDSLRVERAALVGNSLGGATATLVASRDPQRVRALVLVDAAGFRMAPESRPALLRYSAGSLGALLEKMPRPRPLVVVGLRQVFFDDALVTRERVDEYEAPLLRPGAVAAVRSMLQSPAPSRADYETLLLGVRAPTLVLWGAEDRWIPVADADLYARAIPGARKVVLEGCGHMPQEERPAETLRVVREFLAAVPD